MNGRDESGRLPGISPSRGWQFRRVLGKGALRPRRLPRTASPPPAAPGPPPQLPRYRAARTGYGRQASRQVRRPPGERSSNGRNAAHCPGQPLQLIKGTRRSFLTASRKRFSGPPLSAGASADPAGLTARGGQAREKRGELTQSSYIGRTGAIRPNTGAGLRLERLLSRRSA